MDVGDGLLEGGDPEEVEVEGGSGEQADGDERNSGQCEEKEEMAEVGDARGREGFGEAEGLEEGRLGGMAFFGMESIERLVGNRTVSGDWPSPAEGWGSGARGLGEGSSLKGSCSG